MKDQSKKSVPSDRKNEILEAARQLFSQKGYADVSLRGVAEYLGISVGNLTYHFKKKEELVEAVVRRQQESYRKSLPPRNLQGLNRYFLRIIHHQIENGFYLGYYHQLAQICPNAYLLIQRNIVEEMQTGIRDGFLFLEKAGILSKEEIGGQRDYIVSAIIMILLEGPILPVGDRMPMIWSILYPTMTIRGKRNWKNEIAG